MKFGQLKECDARNNFLQKSFRNEIGQLGPELFLLFEKVLYELNKIKASGQLLSYNIFW